VCCVWQRLEIEPGYHYTNRSENDDDGFTLMDALMEMSESEVDGENGR